VRARPPEDTTTSAHSVKEGGEYGDENLFQKKFAPPLSNHERGGARGGRGS
jgi:hypothetical protein